MKAAAATRQKLIKRKRTSEKMKAIQALIFLKFFAVILFTPAASAAANFSTSYRTNVAIPFPTIPAQWPAMTAATNSESPLQNCSASETNRHIASATFDFGACCADPAWAAYCSGSPTGGLIKTPKMEKNGRAVRFFSGDSLISIGAMSETAEVRAEVAFNCAPDDGNWPGRDAGAASQSNGWRLFRWRW